MSIISKINRYLFIKKPLVLGLCQLICSNLFYSSVIYSQDSKRLPKDRVFLKNGRFIEGSILEEKENFIKINIDGKSEIRIQRDNIQYIKKASEEAVKKAEEFEKSQEDKGLVKYKDEWVPKEKNEKLTERDALAEEISRLRKEKERLVSELGQLDGMRLYQNDSFKFSFNPPQGWVQIPVTDSDVICRFTDNSEDDFKEYADVFVSKKTNDSIDQGFIDSSIKKLQEEGNGYLNKIRSFDIIKVDGLNALKVSLSRYFFKETGAEQEASAGDEPFHQKVLVYLIFGGSNMYRVEFSCLTKDYGQYSVLFDNCIKSFIISDRQGGKTAEVGQHDIQTAGNEAPLDNPGSGIPEADNASAAQPSLNDSLAKLPQPSEDFGVDKVFLKNNRILEGTIIQESNDSVKIRVESPSTPEYVISIPRDTIEKIEWLADEKKQRKMKYEEEQIQKGLIKFYGHWVTKEQRDGFYQQAEDEQDRVFESQEHSKMMGEESISQSQNAQEESQRDQEMKEVLTKLKQVEDEKAGIAKELEKQKDITNAKLDEFLERERQEIPIGKVAKGSIGSIVKVLVKSKYAYRERYQGAASGAVIDPKGIIITNYFIGNNPFREDWFVEMPGYEKDKALKATILAYDHILDVAIIKIDTKGLALPAIPIGDSDKLVEGDRILTVGSPSGYKGSYTAGRVLSLEADLIDLIDVNVKLRWNIERKYKVTNPVDLAKRFKNDYGQVKMIQHNGLTYARSNGGPLLNKNGEIVGINQNMNVVGAVPVVLAPSTVSFNMAVSINAIKNQRSVGRYLR